MPPNATLAFEQKLDWTLVSLVSTRSSETGQELGRNAGIFCAYGLRSYASGACKAATLLLHCC
jgi:hypothetical protein